MKRLTSTERAQAVCKAINEFRIVYAFFTSEEMAAQLKSIKCPYAKSIFSILNKTHQIKPTTQGKYVFTFLEPVYYKAIQAALDEVADAQKGYQEKFQNKKSEPKVASKPKEVIKEFTIEQAIALLKANGYKISKPVTTYEEI